MSARVDRLRAYWESLSPGDLDRLGTVYAGDVHFRDPFNDVRGLEALRGILAHMFESLEAPVFRIGDMVEGEDAAVLFWDFEFGIRALRPRERRTIRGASHVRFDAEGRVTSHIDYWDAAGELYTQLPVIGPLMRFLRRRLAG